MAWLRPPLFCGNGCLLYPPPSQLPPYSAHQGHQGPCSPASGTQWLTQPLGGILYSSSRFDTSLVSGFQATALWFSTHHRLFYFNLHPEIPLAGLLCAWSPAHSSFCSLSLVIYFTSLWLFPRNLKLDLGKIQLTSSLSSHCHLPKKTIKTRYTNLLLLYSLA